MDKNNIISIIVPAYNVENYLSECIDSIISETTCDLEILIVNDGSTDRTGEIAENYAEKDSRIKVIHIANSGVSVARNVGIEQSTGSYIMFVDADDALLQGALPYLLQTMCAYDADMVSGFGRRVPDGDSYDKKMIMNNKVSLLMGMDSLRYALQDRLAYAVWGKLYKREFLEGVRFPEGKRIHEDSLFLFRSFLKECVVVITQSIVYKYTVSANSATRSKFDDRFLDMLDVLEEKVSTVKAQYPEFADLSKNMIVKTNMALLINLCKTSDKRYRAIKKEAIQNVIKYKQYFIPTSKFYKNFFFIVTHHLYGLFALYYRIKYKNKANVLEV